MKIFFKLFPFLILLVTVSRAQENVLTKKDLNNFPMALLDGESVSLYVDLSIMRKADPNHNSFDSHGMRMSAPDIMTALWSSEKNFRGNIPWTSLMIVDRVIKPYEREDHERLSDELLNVVSRGFSDRGIMNHHMGLYSKAEKATTRSLDMRSQRFGAFHLTTLTSLNNLGALYRDMGKYAAAEELFQRALSGLEKEGFNNSMEKAVILNNQSMLFLSLGRIDEAEDAIYTAIVVADKFSRDKSKDFLPFLVNKALVKWAKGELDEAEQILTEVKKIKEKRFGKKKTQYARALNHLAALKMEKGNTEGVDVLLLDAYAIYNKIFGDNHPTTANIAGNIGRYYMLSGQFKKAETQLKMAKRSQAYVLNRYSSDYIATLEALAITYWKTGQEELAKNEFDLLSNAILEQIVNYFPAMSEEKKTKFWDKYKPYLMSYFQFISANLDSHPEWSRALYELHLATKGLLLSSTIGVRRDIAALDSKSLMDTYNNWIQLKVDMASYYTMPKKQLFSMGVNLLSLEKKSMLMASELSKGSFKFASIYSKKAPDFFAIRSKLKPDEALVEVVRLTNEKSLPEYLILIITKNDEFPQFAKIKNSEEIESKFLKYHRSSIKFKTEDDYSYQNYWEPFASKLNGFQKVYLSLDGVYNQISISSLKQPGVGYIIDEYQISYISSGGQLMEPSNKIKGNKSILVGDPKFVDEHVLPLPSTRVEVESIQELMSQNSWESIVLMQNEASEATVRNIVNPNVLHIATHGFFLEDQKFGKRGDFGLEVPSVTQSPLHRSGLMLSGASNDKELQNNGILTAHEVMELELDDTKLVVLSACETGLGEIKVGEGVYGLQRAFQIAGADAVIVSLWKVDDKSTQELMTLFYKNWLSGSQMELALEHAQKELREKYEAPYYWASFVLLK